MVSLILKLTLSLKSCFWRRENIYQHTERVFIAYCVSYYETEISRSCAFAIFYFTTNNLSNLHWKRRYYALYFQHEFPIDNPRSLPLMGWTAVKRIYLSTNRFSWFIKASKGAKIRNRYNQVPHLTQDTNGKVTNSQLDTTNESQEVSPFQRESTFITA